MSLVEHNTPGLPPAWPRPEDSLVEAFSGRADLQADVRRVVAWLAANADVSRRQASGGVAVVLGPT
jgi:hypothetical protein